MIRAFLFDIGNVLLKFDFAPAIRRIAAQSEVNDPVEVLGRMDQFKIGFEEGQFDRATFLRSVFDVLKYRGTEAEFISAWEEIFEPNAPMIALLDQLRGRFPLYLLSNTNVIHRECIFRDYPFFSHFTDGIYSHEVHASKPGRAIYEITTLRFNLDPATTFFIDDLLPNIEAAREFGFPAHHYHHDRHELLLTELRQLGVI